MRMNASSFFSWLVMLAPLVVMAAPLRGQTASSSLSGTVTDASGKAIRGATVTVKNEATGKSTEIQTDAAGAYDVRNIAAGDYEVSASAEGMKIKVIKVSVTSGIDKTLNIALSVAGTPEKIQNNKTETTPGNGTKAPPGSGAEPSLSDLGFPSTQTQGNAKEQARLDKRSHMLQVHQRLGLITTIPLAATVISGAFAGGKPRARPTATYMRHWARRRRVCTLQALTTRFSRRRYRGRRSRGRSAGIRRWPGFTAQE